MSAPRNGELALLASHWFRSMSASAAMGRLHGGYAMSFFWKRRQQDRDNTEKEQRHDMERAITAISARLKFLEALTAELISELPPTKRARVLQNLRQFVREQKILPPPTSVPPDKQQEFHDELRRAVDILIETKRT
jgi:hypothetical protein